MTATRTAPVIAPLFAAALLLALPHIASAVVVGDLRSDYVAGANAGDTTAATNPGKWDYYAYDEESGLGTATLLQWDTASALYERPTDNHTNGSAAGSSFTSWPLVGLTNPFASNPGATELFLHPGDDNFTPGGLEFLLLRWTAGAGDNGSLNVAGNVRSLTTAGPAAERDGVTLTILVNGVQFFQDSVLSADGVGEAFNFDAPILAGQTVEFLLSHGPAEFLFDDSTALSAVLTLEDETSAVPAPAALPAGLALIALIASRRR